MQKLDNRRSWIQLKREILVGEKPGKYMAKILYRQNDRKFKIEYLKKLKRN